MEPLFLQPYFQPKIWGGRKLETLFNYELPEGKIGEAWAISAHPHGPSTIENGPLKGLKLNEAYEKNPEYFGNPTLKVFPLLTKILDAEDDLSVQVHPDDEYAAIHEHELGKTECWYVLAAEPDAALVYGHTAKTREELANMINSGDFKDLLSYKKVKPGDFVYVPSGSIHALTKGIVVLETQQSSDTTYRLYDYDRVDDKTGEKRELHLQQSIDVTDVPFVEPKLDVKNEKVGDTEITRYLDSDVSPYFSVDRYEVKSPVTVARNEKPYLLMSVTNGDGSMVADGKNYSLKKGMHFIIPNQIASVELDGAMEVIVSAPKNN